MRFRVFCGKKVAKKKKIFEIFFRCGVGGKIESGIPSPRQEDSEIRIGGIRDLVAASRVLKNRQTGTHTRRVHTHITRLVAVVVGSQSKEEKKV